MPVAQGEQNKTESGARSSAASRLAAKRAAKAAAKAAKRATGPVPNEVARGVTAVQHWYDANLRMVWLGLGAGALLGIAWLAIAAQMGKQDHEAASSLSDAVSVAIAPVVAEGEEAPEDATETFSSNRARAQKARADFDKTVRRFASTAAAGWARVGEGNALEQLGKHEKARKLYGKVLSTKSDASPFLRMLALQGMGFSFEAEKNYAAAEKRFQEIGELDHGAYKAVGDYHKARMLIAQGKSKDAAGVLEALVKADRARPAGEEPRWKGVMQDAQTLIDELSVELDQPKLRTDVGSGSGSSGLSKGLMDALRSHLGGGKGSAGLNKEALKKLEQEIKKSGAKTKSSGANGPSAPVGGATKSSGGSSQSAGGTTK